MENSSTQATHLNFAIIFPRARVDGADVVAVFKKLRAKTLNFMWYGSQEFEQLSKYNFDDDSSSMTK